MESYTTDYNVNTIEPEEMLIDYKK